MAGIFPIISVKMKCEREKCFRCCCCSRCCCSEPMQAKYMCRELGENDEVAGSKDEVKLGKENIRRGGGQCFPRIII